MEGVKNLGTGIVGGIGNIASAAGKAVEKTTALAGKATDVAIKLGDKSLDAAGVIGSATLDAANAIGSASVKAASDITTKGLSAASSVATGVLSATDKVTNAALDASATTVTAATATVATAATVSADVTKQVITKTGDVLKAGVGAATKITESGLNGVRRVADLAAQKGELAANKIEASTSAKSKAFEDIGRQRLVRKEAIDQFKKSSAEIVAGVKELVSVQKTALAANIHMYRKAKCGWLSRTLGTCPVKVSEDTTSAKRIATAFLANLDRASADAFAKLSTGKDAGEVTAEYLQKMSALSDSFQSEFSKLIDKYSALTDQALSGTGGRRKSYRKKRRSSRASRRRPVVRGYFA